MRIGESKVGDDRKMVAQMSAEDSVRVPCGTVPKL
jgi:hypothetical protein